MRKEIDAIRVKDISQGGLTQGQQTQIARNEQRIAQIMEELDSLEETLNESIQESVGARIKISHGKKKGSSRDEDQDEILSDDDEFYDRTNKKPSIKKTGEQQTVETADTLLDKKDVITKEMEEKVNLLQEEKAKMVTNTSASSEQGDELDAYMTGLSSQLALDKTLKIQKELATLQSELDRILYLLKIADPNGEAAKKKVAKSIASRSVNSDGPCSGIPIEPVPERMKKVQEKSSSRHPPPEQVKEATIEDNNLHAQEEIKEPLYSVTKPQWLGAAKEPEPKEIQQEGNESDAREADQFVDYKDRKILASADEATGTEQGAPCLIIRKRKHVREPGLPDDLNPRVSTSISPDAETAAADAVALLLRHKKGFVVPDDEGIDNHPSPKQEGKSEKKSRRVLGPERPAFLDRNSDYESWMPPEGQSGDGRTSLNDRLGY